MRISREQMFMDIAEVVAKRSTCLRNNVGAVIVEGNNIISIGYNGVGTGCPHCTTETCLGKGCDIAFHAEWNALTRIRMLNPDLSYSIYVTVSPCLKCAFLITQKKIKSVYYRYPYRDRTGIDFLLNKGVKVFKVLPSGEIIEEELEWQGK